VAYYHGDYYQGDYYQGDPFLGAIIGGAASWLGKKLFGRGAKAAAGSLIKAGVGGAAIGVGTQLALPTTAPIAPPLMSIPLPGGSVFRPQAILPGGVPAFGRPSPPPVRAAAAAAPGMCPSGYHLNKSMTRSGAPPGTVWVRNRSMNVANPRALRRSLRRVAGFGKLAKRAKRDINRAAKAVG
jgi:hypothetical protein